MSLAAGRIEGHTVPPQALPRTPQEYIETISGWVIRHVDLASFRIAYKDIFEQRIYHFDANNPRPVIIDGGACIGLASLYFKQTYPEARVLAFEPDERLCGLIRKNLTANGLNGVTVLNAALSNESREAAFLSDGADGGRLVQAETEVMAGRTKCVVLSDYIHGPVDFLKLNIEGEEVRVLEELESSGKLSQVREMVVEYHDWPEGPQQLGNILELLSRNGYRYMVHDFDRQTGPASKPPFRLRRAPWYCLIYAKRHPEQLDAGIVHQPSEHLPTEPVSRVFGMDRGTAIDRHYIEAFLERHRADIRGRVLEVGDATYTSRFGGPRVERSDVLHATAENRHATLVGDLQSGEGIPRDAFDCILLTQTLNVTYDARAAVATCYRALRPGGVLLATVPGISQISRYDMERWGDYWRFTTLSGRRVCEEFFGRGRVRVESHGNVGASVSFLIGWSLEEVGVESLATSDADYPLIVTIRAVRDRTSE